MNKLADFPLERSGLGDAPDDTVIVAWPAWSLTVGDVRAAVASQEDKTPQHSVTEQASSDTGELRRLVNEYRDACDMVQGHAIPQWRKIVAYLDARAKPLPSTAATQPEQASALSNCLNALRTAWHVSGVVQGRTDIADAIKRAEAALAIPASTAPASTAASEQRTVGCRYCGVKMYEGSECWNISMSKECASRAASEQQDKPLAVHAYVKGLVDKEISDALDSEQQAEAVLKWRERVELDAYPPLMRNSIALQYAEEEIAELRARFGKDK